MKNKSERGQYRYLKNKLFMRVLGMLFLAAVGVFGLYSFLLRGHFADFVVSFLYYFIFHDYSSALRTYNRIFREHQDQFFLVSVVVLFLLLMTLFIRGFVKYLKDINKGIDSLLDMDMNTVSLVQELSPVEKKINAVKFTLVQQRNEIRAAEQRKNDLIMYLAHDLKTPLSSVLGYLNLLRDEGQISEELREKYLSIALDKAERLEDLINEFFEITRFNLSHITLQYGEIDLVRLLEQLIFEFTPMLQEKNLTCELHAEDGYKLKCDADKIQRVFDNLLRNAVLYSFDGTVVDVTVAQQQGFLVIKFLNRGAHIPKEKLERIFEQFYRLDSSRSTKSGGAGLGLAIAKQIVELHGGTITARSGQEEVEFTVTLPQP